VTHVVAACSSCRAFTGDVTAFDVEAATVRAMIGELERRYPGFGEHIERRMAIAIDGEIHQDALFEPLGPESEVYLIPKIGGG
jgi:molybdopterin converting factor small subunit